jgi:hypothetical protein
MVLVILEKLSARPMRNNLTKIAIVFLVAFLLNLIWEHLHSLLYDNYKGGEITNFILIRASFNDAIFISLASVFFFIFKHTRHAWLVALSSLLLLSIGIEVWALETFRWSYKEIMPLVPYLAVGLTPVIQLALLGHISFRLSGLLPRQVHKSVA